MKRMLIVDDQQLVREGIIAMLGEMSLRYDAIDQASNSREAIAMIERSIPSIILLDIHMPGEDGFSVAEYLRRKRVMTHVIVMTSYKRFDYAMRAFQYKVDTFLLKPIRHADLYQALMDFAGDDALDAPAPRGFNVELLADFLKGRDLSIQMDRLLKHLGLSLLESVDYQVALMLGPTEALKKIEASAALQNEQLRFAFLLPGKGLMLVSETRSGALPDLIAPMILETGIYCGISGIDSSLSMLQRLFQEAERNSLFARRNDIGGQVLSPGPKLLLRDLLLCELPALIEALCAGERQQLSTQINRLFQSFLTITGQMDEIRAALSPMLNRFDALIQRLLPGMTDDARGRISDARTLLSMKSAILDAADCPQEGRAFPPKMREMLGDIAACYATDVSLSYLANQMDITYNYASNLFTKCVGMSFTEYLLHYRLEKAALLLRSSNYTIEQVAARVGIPNQQYFHRRFKQTFLATPNDYRRMS